MPIHPTAVISDHAQIAPDVEIGPYCIIEAGVTVGTGCVLKAGVHLLGEVTLGSHNTIHSYAVIGDTPQDLSHTSEIQSTVIIGDHNIIREHVTIHRGAKSGGITRLGDHCLLMATSHIGHDSTVGDHVILANGTMLGGHVSVGDRVFLGGGTGVHQLVRIGSYAMSQGNSSISQDVPPYCTCSQLNQLRALNVVGLRRAGFTTAQRAELKTLFTLLFQSGKNLSDALCEAERSTWSPTALLLLNAAKSPSRKGIMRR